MPERGCPGLILSFILEFPDDPSRPCCSDARACACCSHPFYRQLEAEYDHLTSDETVEEGIIVKQYTFTESGRRFGRERGKFI